MAHGFTHFDNEGNAIMVDVSEKEITHRSATAIGKIIVGKDIISAINSGDVKKGDVLGVARVAGIMAVKQTSSLIPMCHTLLITKASIDYEVGDEDVTVKCTVECDGKTGVEMEALTGASTALLTIYDMCKAMSKEMIITDIHLLTKSGGKSGDFVFGGSNND
ncbi:MAG: cyclic pyranopterin monophosphate synthase MoaC [Oscillospiraceae bacterium]|nr:cyclic pyranopterin monophosphate synthase MoaC [Oscillospiraceae bacterium]